MGFFSLLIPKPKPSTRHERLAPARRLADAYNSGRKKTFSNPGTTFIDADENGVTVQLSLHTDGRVWVTEDLEEWTTGSSGRRRRGGKLGSYFRPHAGLRPDVGAGFGGNAGMGEMEEGFAAMMAAKAGPWAKNKIGGGPKPPGLLKQGPGLGFGAAFNAGEDMPWSPNILGNNMGMGPSGLKAQGISAHDQFFAHPQSKPPGFGFGQGFGNIGDQMPGFGQGPPFGQPPSSHKHPPFMPQQQQQHSSSPISPHFPTLPFQPHSHQSQHSPQAPHFPTLPFQQPSSQPTSPPSHAHAPTSHDPLLTAKLPLGARGVREYVPGQSKLDPAGFGDANDPAANWRHMKALEELREKKKIEEGKSKQGESGGSKRGGSRR